MLVVLASFFQGKQSHQYIQRCLRVVGWEEAK